MDNLVSFLSNHKGGSIEVLVAEATKAGIWQNDDFDELIYQAKAAEIRRTIKSFKDKDGFPLWGNTKKETPDGEIEQVYKPTLLFDIDEYKQTIIYNIDRGQIPSSATRAPARPGLPRHTSCGGSVRRSTTRTTDSRAQRRWGM